MICLLMGPINTYDETCDWLRQLVTICPVDKFDRACHISQFSTKLSLPLSIVADNYDPIVPPRVSDLTPKAGPAIL